MSDQPEHPKGLPGTKRIALTIKEQELIEAYRRKTEADRAWNAALDVTCTTIQRWADDLSTIGEGVDDKRVVDLLDRINGRRREV